MIVDVTGTVLIPGNRGRECPGNGESIGKEGNMIRCCCDECAYMQCCLEDHCLSMCKTCDDVDCPRAGKGDLPTAFRQFLEE